jgi:hypothetical protein
MLMMKDKRKQENKMDLETENHSKDEQKKRRSELTSHVCIVHSTHLTEEKKEEKEVNQPKINIDQVHSDIRQAYNQESKLNSKHSQPIVLTIPLPGSTTLASILEGVISNKEKFNQLIDLLDKNCLEILADWRRLKVSQVVKIGLFGIAAVNALDDAGKLIRFL